MTENHNAVLDWTSSCPDLSPIETLRNVMKDCKYDLQERFSIYALICWIFGTPSHPMIVKTW